MERKITCSLRVISIVLLLAISITAKENPNNLFSVVYVGDSNVTAGKSFWIQCLSKPPIEWLKDGHPIQMHFIRHTKDDYSYTQRDKMFKDSDLIESTLSVNHALKIHSGKYKCNGEHQNFHMLFVNDEKITVQENFDDDDDDDHQEMRVSFDPILPYTRAPESTATMFIDETSTSKQYFPSNFDESYEVEQLRENDEEQIAVTNNESLYKFPIFEAPTTLPTTVLDPFYTSTTIFPNVHVDEKTMSFESTQVYETIAHPISTVEIPQLKGKIIPTYEDGRTKKLFQIGKPLSLTCTVVDDDSKKLVWKKNDVLLKDVEELKTHHFKVDEKAGKLTIDKAREEDAGNYTCSLNEEFHKFEALAQIVVKVPQNTYVVENEKLDIICTVKGTFPEITWKFTNNTEDTKDDSTEDIDAENERIKLESHGGVENSRLIIDHVKMSDRGVFICVGTNELMRDNDIESAQSEGKVRVKDSLAALWPFLGICAEVFILCTIILIYEKRRNKTDLEESDTDQSPDQKNEPLTKDSDTRHRK